MVVILFFKLKVGLYCLHFTDLHLKYVTYVQGGSVTFQIFKDRHVDLHISKIGIQHFTCLTSRFNVFRCVKIGPSCLDSDCLDLSKIENLTQVHVYIWSASCGLERPQSPAIRRPRIRAGLAAFFTLWRVLVIPNVFYSLL